MKQFISSKTITIAFILISFKSFSQTPYWEQMVIENIQTYISDINQHLFPLLKNSERKRLEKIKFEITPSENEYTAESDSEEKTIKFSRKLIRLIVRTSVAQLIEQTQKLNRERFWGFYTSFYPYLYLDTEPEIAAELTKAEIDILKTIGNTHEFRWVVEQKIMFIYLHELCHQIQEYAVISKQVYEKKISESEKSSLLFRLEEDADKFAVDKIAKMGVYPLEYIDVLNMIALIKEMKSATVQQMVQRTLNVFEFCYVGLGCENRKDELCTQIKEGYFKYIQLRNHYKQLYNAESLKGIKSNAITSLNVYSIYNMGDLYLKGGSVYRANIDSALYFYKLGANLTSEKNNLYGALNKIILISTIEYCQLLTGKIYELKMNDKKSAVYYYQKAMKTSSFLPISYYHRLIQRLQKT